MIWIIQIRLIFKNRVIKPVFWGMLYCISRSQEGIWQWLSCYLLTVNKREKYKLGTNRERQTPNSLNTIRQRIISMRKPVEVCLRAPSSGRFCSTFITDFDEGTDGIFIEFVEDTKLRIKVNLIHGRKKINIWKTPRGWNNGPNLTKWNRTG